MSLDLNTEVTVPDIDKAIFEEQAETAKANHPVSREDG
jgi:hypothetical protein